jgi:hypothetical protein
LDDADVVWFVLESCMKEAALVSAGEVTFSCPSINLWHAPELEDFSRKLQGKRVYVVCDSDWNRETDDLVIRQVLLARDRLKSYGIDAHSSAPPTPVDREPEGEWEIRCTNKKHTDDAKHGVDDHLGPCTGRRTQSRKVEDVIVISRETGYGLAEWLADNPPVGRKPRADGLERDAIVLRWLALHAGVNGNTTVYLRTVAANLQEELGSESEDAARKAVERAVRKLIEYGVVEEVEAISDRRPRRHFRQEFPNPKGILRVRDRLQAETIITRIRDHRP